MTAPARRGQSRGGRRTPAPVIAVLAAIVWTWSQPARAQAGIDAPFRTVEDGTRLQDILRRKDFGWIRQKAFIAGVAARGLQARGFDPVTAERIARDWDGWRFDFETGARILPTSPLRMTAADAALLASRIPTCLSDLAGGGCTIRYAAETGCALTAEQAAVCARNYGIVREAAASFGPAGGSLYGALTCLEETGKGADLVVFAPKDVQAATKLRFDAVAQAKAAPLAPAPAAPPRPAARRAPACPALMADSAAARRLLRAEFGRGNIDLAAYDLRDEVESLVSGVRARVRIGSSVDDLVAPARALGIDLQARPKVTLRLPKAAGLRGPLLIDDFRDGWIGAHATAPYETSTQLDTAGGEPAIITEISPAGPAARAGLRPGDRILRFDGQEVGSSKDLVVLARNTPAGREVDLTVERGGRRQTLRVTVNAIVADAERGDPLASRLLGRLNTFPLGSPPDSRAALGWFEKAAAGGDTLAMMAVARLHFGSSYGPSPGLARNDRLGMQWLRRAADAGNPHAAHDLGGRLHSGKGTARDHAAARRWYEAAAEGGVAAAMNDLGVMLARGEGGPRSRDEARRWFIRGARAGHRLAMRNAGMAYRDGFGGRRNLDAARSWFERAAEKGDRTAAELLKKL